MANQQLLDYIKQASQQGANQEQIKTALVSAGWQMADVDAALATTATTDTQPLAPVISSPIAVQPAISAPALAPTTGVLPGATKIFGQAWTIYKQRFGVLLGVTVIPMLIVAVVAAIFMFSGLLGGSLFSPKVSGDISGISSVIFSLMAVMIPLMVALSIVVLVIQIWAQTALLYAIKDSQEKIGIFKSYKNGWFKILPYLWLSLLVGFVVNGGTLLLIVPGIIFSIWFSLSGFVLISEDIGGMNAMLKSREYIRGKWWNTLWKFIFIWIVVLLISLIPAVILVLLKNYIAMVVGEIIIGILLAPLMITYTFLVYSNLRAFKGNVTVTASKGRKAWFIVVAILGILAIPFFSVLPTYLGLKPSMNNNGAFETPPAYLESINNVIESPTPPVDTITNSTTTLTPEAVRDYDREDSISQISAVLFMYNLDSKSYPATLEELVPKYFSVLPIDPVTAELYQYKLQPDGLDYEICIQLESTGAQKCFTSKF